MLVLVQPPVEYQEGCDHLRDLSLVEYNGRMYLAATLVRHRQVQARHVTTFDFRHVEDVELWRTGWITAAMCVGADGLEINVRRPRLLIAIADLQPGRMDAGENGNEQRFPWPWRVNTVGAKVYAEVLQLILGFDAIES